MMLIFIYFLLSLFNLKFIEKSFIHFIFFYSYINTFFQVHQQIITHYIIIRTRHFFTHSIHLHKRLHALFRLINIYRYEVIQIDSVDVLFYHAARLWQFSLWWGWFVTRCDGVDNVCLCGWESPAWALDGGDFHVILRIIIKLFICGVVHQYEYRVVCIIVIVGIAHSHHRLFIIVTTDHCQLFIQPFPKIQLQIILGEPHICKVYLWVCIALYPQQAVAHILL